MHPGSIPGEASNSCNVPVAFWRRDDCAGAPYVHRTGRTMMDADYSEMRTKMVDGQIRTTDVTSAAVLSAMLDVPREEFVPAARRKLAYIDEHLLVSDDRAQGGRFLMQPSPFAKLVQLADIRPGDSVLVVGADAGYSAAVLSRLASTVLALESDPVLAERASSVLAATGCDNVAVVVGPLPEGHAARAPYDVIFFGGGVDVFPAKIGEQLKEGGRLVVVEGRGNTGLARLYVRENGVVTGRRAFNAAVKPLPGFERDTAFEF